MRRWVQTVAPVADWLPAWAWTLVVAPFAGSFLGVLVRRLPADRPVFLSRSACESCDATLGARDLLPLLSALWLGGRCRRCGSPIAPFHWQIELAATGVALAVVSAGGDATALWAGCGLGWTLLALAWIDVLHFRLPDVLTLPLILAGLGVTFLVDPGAMTDHAAAAALGFVSLQALAVIYRLWRGRDGLGMGDAKLLAAGGAWLGIEQLGPILFGAALFSLVLLLVGRLRGAALSATTQVAFGPGLSTSIFVAWLFQA